MDMRINIEKCPEQIQLLAEELKKQIQLENAEDGVILCVKEQEAQGFRIEKSADKLEIFYGNLPALCRAILTAAQRTEESYSYQEEMSCEELGFMLDCSRNAVMRVEQLKKYVRILALMGYTYVGLYMEDTFEVKEEPYVGYMRGAMTQAELKEIDQYAAGFGMEVRAFIQTLAHLNQITRYCEYDKMIDCNDILLAGEERTYEFLEHLIGSIASGLSSRKINIGMDEAHMVGLGKYLDQHGYTKRFDIMQKHLERVLAITDKYGYKVEMWSDMFFRLAYNGEYYVKDKDLSFDIQIPENVKLVYWDYYALDVNHYEIMFTQHKKLAKDIGFAGGAWKWHGLTPHNQYSLHTSKAAMTSCINNEIKDIAITCWGDDGAEASAFSVLPALYANAEYLYTKDTEMDPMTIEKSKFEILTGIPFDAFMELDKANILPEDGKFPSNSSKYFLYNDPLIGTFDSVVPEDISNYYDEVSKKLALYSENDSLGYVFKAQSLLCNALAVKADLGQRIRTAYVSGDKETLKEIAEQVLPELIIRIDEFYSAMEVQWNTESKSFGFEVQCVRLGGVKQRLTYVKTILLRYLAGEVSQIDELEASYLPYAYTEPKTADKLAYNLWRNMVSPSVTAW